MISNQLVESKAEITRIEMSRPERCAIVVDKNLALGRLANAIAVVALTIGQRHPVLVGAPLSDKSGHQHPGLIPIGIPVLAAGPEDLSALRTKAIESGCDVIDFPVLGQITTDYRQFREAIACTEPLELRYTAIALVGAKKQVRSVTGALPLLR